MSNIKEFKIIDDLDTADKGAIEVELEFVNGNKRWAYFFTPDGISSSGYLIPGTEGRYHLGETHMIFVSVISHTIIEKTIKMLEAENLLEARTRPMKAM